LHFLPVNVKYSQSQEGLLRNSEERRKFAMLFSPKEKGQGLVEYALILVLVAIVVIAALMILGPIIGNVFSRINSSLSGV
jgi:pilus assembly protein Flp/PilA